LSIWQVSDGQRATSAKNVAVHEAYQLRGRSRVFMCKHCNSQESVTSGTVMHRTKLPLMIWFWAAYLLSQDKRGVSAMHIKRELDLHYDTAWTLLHKLRRALADDEGSALTGVVEVDETYYGGKGSAESRGRSLSNKNKSLIVMAVERKPARGKNAPGINQSGFVCGSAKVALVASASSDDLGKFVHGALRLEPTCSLTAGLATQEVKVTSSMSRRRKEILKMPVCFCPRPTC
jgi:transposase-like protein